MNNYKSLRQGRARYCQPALTFLDIVGCEGVVCTSPTGAMSAYGTSDFDWEDAGYDQN